jgi:hypothetical protein
MYRIFATIVTTETTALANTAFLRYLMLHYFRGTKAKLMKSMIKMFTAVLKLVYTIELNISAAMMKLSRQL